MKTFYKLGILFTLSLLLCSVISSDYYKNHLQWKDYDKKLQKEIYVSQKSGNYYSYQVYSNNGKIFIELVDKDLKEYRFPYAAYDKKNVLYFRTAYNKFIILEEKTPQNKSVTYWVLTITKTEKAYTLENFPVSSTVDNQGYKFNDLFLLTGVAEYDEYKQFLYVYLVVQGQGGGFDIYGIDLKNKGNILIINGWFDYDKKNPQHIVGGNSRVLVEATNDQFWFDTRNNRTPDEPTIYKKVNISSFTNLPIYAGGSGAYSFLSSYFQYVSLSSNKLKLTTFIYKDYEYTKKIYAQDSLKSKSQPIKIFSDQQSYFIAASDNDVYLSTVDWNAYKKDYQVWSSTLTQLISNKYQRRKWVQIFNSAILIVRVQGRFFILTENYFYVYSQTETYSEKLKNPCNSQSDLQEIMLSEIKSYLSSKCKC